MDKDQKVLRILEGIFGSWRETIPVSFHRTFAGDLFQTCDYCDTDLLGPRTSYIIHKYYEEGELRQETVQCHLCRKRLSGGYSQKSIETQKKLWSSVDRSARYEIAANPDVDRTSILTSRCILCGLRKEEASAYCEYANCEGREIVFFIYPMMICRKCIIRLFDALSEKTKEHRRRYYEDHYSLPPDLMSRDPMDISLQYMLG
jgi:hypothetical protein